MNLERLLYRLQKLNGLIQNECTGTPEELADKLGCSKRSITNYIDALRTLGAKISYSRFSKTYLYNDDFDISIIIKK